MSFSAEELACGRFLVDRALEEDLNKRGDVTSVALLNSDAEGQAALVARAAGVLAGLPIVNLLLSRWSEPPLFTPLKADGDALRPGDRIGVFTGSLRGILGLERTALNFLQHLSGIATLTRRFVDAVAGTNVKIMDTRKTLPGWRLLAKYAVRQGGGTNHRLGLYDGFLVKDNHLAGLAATGMEPIGEAVRRARALQHELMRQGAPSLPVEIEVDRLDQFDIVLALGPDIVLLDNMSPAQMREAVGRRDRLAPGILLEASGGVTLDTVRAIAESGVDRISVGALTHSAPALDLALDYEVRS
ncbi:MAG: carboxylating nicotinate-nucleotide diphosphorylase [Gemmataceae bacterium]